MRYKGRMTWQPISTAPKSPDFVNEIRILLWGPKFEKDIVIGCWRPTSADDGGFWFNSEDEGPLSWGECEPTHWMPLPEPPTPE